MTLLQTAKNDENGEKLLYNPTKQTELQAVLPGQAVPIAMHGIFTLSDSGFDGNATDYTIGAPVKMSHINPGKLTGANHVQGHWGSGHFGRVLGTGSRTNQGPTSDQFLGDYIVVKF